MASMWATSSKLSCHKAFQGNSKPSMSVLTKASSRPTHKSNLTERLQETAERAMAGLMTVLVSGSLLLGSAAPANAVLVSPNAQIARTVDAALRRSIPAFNPQVKEVQKKLEEIAYLLRIPQGKPFRTMGDNVNFCIKKVAARDNILEGVTPSNKAQGEALVDELADHLQKLKTAIESKQPDYIGVRVTDALKAVAQLELLQAPGLPFAIPKEYADLPRLVGRAVVEFTVERRDGSSPFVDTFNGGTSSTAEIQVTLDGYSAPISAGNFLKNVMDKKYDGREIRADRTAVAIPTPAGQDPGSIPLEILPLGEFDPLYRLPLDIQNGELPVLPLSITGAVAMTHVPDDQSVVNGDEWFVFKFDKQQSGLAGLAFDEGTFGIFGYITQGLDLVPKLQQGDVIVKSRVVSGAEKLVQG